MRKKTENMDIIVDKNDCPRYNGSVCDSDDYAGCNRSNVFYDHVRSGSRCRKLIEFPEHHQYNRAGLP